MRSTQLVYLRGLFLASFVDVREIARGFCLDKQRQLTRTGVLRHHDGIDRNIDPLVGAFLAHRHVHSKRERPRLHPVILRPLVRGRVTVPLIGFATAPQRRSAMIVAARYSSCSHGPVSRPSHTKISGSAIFSMILAILSRSRSSSLRPIRGGRSPFFSITLTRFFETPASPTSLSAASGGQVDIRRVGRTSGLVFSNVTSTYVRLFVAFNVFPTSLCGLHSRLSVSLRCKAQKPVVVHVHGLRNVLLPSIGFIPVDCHRSPDPSASSAGTASTSHGKIRSVTQFRPAASFLNTISSGSPIPMSRVGPPAFIASSIMARHRTSPSATVNLLRTRRLPAGVVACSPSGRYHAPPLARIAACRLRRFVASSAAIRRPAAARRFRTPAQRPPASLAAIGWGAGASPASRRRVDVVQ